MNENLLEKSTVMSIKLTSGQNYVKLMRALVLSRILKGATELNHDQREKMEAQLKEIQSLLELSEQEFYEVLLELEKNPDSFRLKQQESVTEEDFVERTAVCLNKGCRHRFVVKVHRNAPYGQRCPKCQKNALFALDS